MSDVKGTSGERSILVATWCAAIAAALSVVATFTQVHATFTDTLYTKQADSLGQVLATAASIDGTISSFFSSSLSDPQTIGSELRKDEFDKQKGEQFRQSYSDLEAAAKTLNVAVKTTEIVSPPELDASLDDMKNTGARIEYDFREIYVLGIRHDPNFDQRLSDLTRDLFTSRDHLDTLQATMLACLRPILVSGQFLTSGNVADCTRRLAASTLQAVSAMGIARSFLLENSRFPQGNRGFFDNALVN